MSTRSNSSSSIAFRIANNNAASEATDYSAALEVRARLRKASEHQRRPSKDPKSLELESKSR